MANSALQVAIVGLDHHYWAFSLADAISEHSGVELAVVGDHDQDRAQEAGRLMGVRQTTSDLRALIEDPAIDVVASFISVDQNPEICIAAARAGKHIFSVKPLARTEQEATGILQAVVEAGVVFMPAESTSRLSKLNQQLKDWVNEGRFGRLLTATWSQHAGLPQRWPGDADPGWFVDPTRAPGGGWIDHSIYHLDRLRWLLADEVKSIGGFSGNLKYPELAVEDYGAAIVEFTKGLIATIEVTWISPTNAYRHHWNLIGTDGAVAYDSLTGRLSLAGDFPPFSGWIHHAPQMVLESGLDHLIACVRQQATPIADVHDAWRNLAVCRAFYAGATAGQMVAPATKPAS